MKKSTRVKLFWSLYLLTVIIILILIIHKNHGRCHHGHKKLNQKIYDFSQKLSFEETENAYASGQLPTISNNQTLMNIIQNYTTDTNLQKAIIDTWNASMQTNNTETAYNQIYNSYSSQELTNLLSSSSIDYNTFKIWIASHINKIMHAFISNKSTLLLTTGAAATATTASSTTRDLASFETSILNDIYEFGGITLESNFTTYFNTPYSYQPNGVDSDTCSVLYENLSSSCKIKPTLDKKSKILKMAYNLIQISDLMHMYLEIVPNPLSTTFNPSLTAYKSDPVWNKMSADGYLTNIWGLTNVIGILNQYYDGSQSLYGIMGKYGNNCIIVFRPSALSQDWSTNFGLGSSIATGLLADLETLLTGSQKFITSNATPTLGLTFGMDFMTLPMFTNMANSMMPQIRNYIASNFPNNSPQEIIIGGHSLGAIMGELTGLCLASDNQNVSLITYNGPYIGNDTFYAQMNTVLPKHYRFQMQYDAVSCGSKAVFNNSNGLPLTITGPAQFDIDPAINSTTTMACLQVGIFPETYQFFWNQQYYNNMSYTEWILLYIPIRPFRTQVIDYTQYATQHSGDFFLRKEKTGLWRNLIMNLNSL